MKLYYSPGLCSQAPHIVLREAGVPFGLVKVDLVTKLTTSGTSFFGINPLGYVPALELDDGVILTESATIMHYIADLVPDTGLAPAFGSFERVRLQQMTNFLSTEVHKSFVPLIYELKNPRFGDYARFMKPKLKKRFAWLDVQLALRPYILGSTFTLADAYLFVLTNWAKASWIESVFDTDLDLSEFENLREWHARVARRPAVQAALQAEGQLSSSDEQRDAA
jgi:glutathione S-transferase